MTTASEDQPLIPDPNPNADATTPPSDEPTETTSPEDTRPAPPPENEGSGRFAVFSPELGNFVSGVMDKKAATAASKSMKADKEAITHGHKLEVREV